VRVGDTAEHPDARRASSMPAAYRRACRSLRIILRIVTTRAPDARRFDFGRLLL